MKEAAERCILCFKPLQIGDARVGADEHYKKLIKCCKKLLHDDHKKELGKWKFYKGCPMPFCAVCFNSSDNLCQIEKQLEELYCYLEECIATFDTEISSSRKLYSSKECNTKDDSNNCNRDPSVQNVVTDNVSLDIRMCQPNRVKTSSGQLFDEELSLSEDSDDNFEDVGSPGFPEDAGQDSLEVADSVSADDFLGVELTSSRENSPSPLPPITQNITRALQEKVSNVCPKDLRVTLERLQLNTNKKVRKKEFKRFSIFDDEILPLGRRKAAIQAIEAFRKHKDDIDDDAEDVGRSRSRKRKIDPIDEILGDVYSGGDSSESESEQRSDSRSRRKRGPRIRYQDSYKVNTIDGREVPPAAYLKIGFKCVVCNGFVGSCKELESHSESLGHVNEKIIVCPDCPKLFYRIRDLREHSRHHRLILKTCEICGMLFTNIVRFHAHTALHKTQRFLSYVYQCSVCEVKWVSMSALFKHIASEHADVAPTQCDLCNRVYYTNEAFDKHKLLHEWKEGDDPIDETNQFTEWTFATIEEINEKSEPPIPLAKMYTGFRCEVCDMYLESSVGVRKHSETSGHVNNKSIECIHCHVMFYRERDVTSHRQNNKCLPIFRYKKAPPTLYASQYNKLRYKLKKPIGRRGRPSKVDRLILKTELIAEQENGEYSNSLRKKVKLKGPNSSGKKWRKRFQCCICQVTFMYSKELDKHGKETGHVTEREFACTDCPKRFYRAYDLADHKKNHLFSPTACEICGKLYDRHVSFKRHMLSHDKAKRVSIIRCSVCQIRWQTVKHLEDHINTEHKDVEPLKCDKCERQYYNQEKLDEHIKVHAHCISKDVPFEMPDEESEWTWQNSERYKEEKPPVPIEKLSRGFPCGVCGRWFEFGKLLSVHSQETGHINTKTLSCYDCGKPFYRKFDLHRHNNRCTEKIQPQTVQNILDTLLKTTD